MGPSLKAEPDRAEGTGRLTPDQGRPGKTRESGGAVWPMVSSGADGGAKAELMCKQAAMERWAQRLEAKGD